MTVNSKIPRLALTPGEPAGIGPDICLQLVQQALPYELVVIGSPSLLQQRAKKLSLPVELVEINLNEEPSPNIPGIIKIYPVELPAPCIPGELNVANSAYVIETLEKAVTLCLSKQMDAMVTGPVHKAIIAQSGIAFTGHTEFLAKLAGVDQVLMTFYTPEFILGLVTTHCALNKVSEFVTPDKVKNTLTLLQNGLTHYFNKPNAKIGVCGLNPHAGENGLLGVEEQTILTPIIKAYQQQGFDIIGPLSADTLFTKQNRAPFDAIVAMYHDQGLAPLKALFFNEIVNVTLGLPFIRTSVDHGTALDKAGFGTANHHSLQLALNLAATMALTTSNG